MSQAETCWTLVDGAAGGDQDARTRFAKAYLPVVRSYLGARWGRGPLAGDIDDAVQETFVECFRDGGALGRAERGNRGRFRTFLYAVVRNVARRHEEKSGRERQRRNPGVALSAVIADDPAQSRVFDRTWAVALMRRAAARQRTEAGPDQAAQRRVKLLELRFGEDLPIRAIAERWNVEAAHLHREYAKARAEFRRALEAEVAHDHEGPAAEIARECATLVGLFG